MASLPALAGIDLTPGPDLHPLYPHPSHVSQLLTPSSGLSPAQRVELVTHCLTRACAFGDIQVLTYLLSDPQAQPHVDLNVQDEDGLGLITVAILGFGAESDRDVEREECVRLLIQEGADPNLPDHGASAFHSSRALTYTRSRNAVGWTALHHAALFSPPTLVSYLLTHGCSPLTQTRRNLTALDIVTGYSRIPGREDVALLLEEAMREEGWQGGGRRERQRKVVEENERRRTRRHELMSGVGRVLGLSDRWWGALDLDEEEETVAAAEDDSMDIDDVRLPFPLFPFADRACDRGYSPPRTTSLQCSSFRLHHYPTSCTRSSRHEDQSSDHVSQRKRSTCCRALRASRAITTGSKM